MTQVSKYPLSKDVSDRIFETFLKAFLKLNQKKELKQFLTDLLSPTEKIMLVKRLAIAILLEKGYQQRRIQNVLKVSLPTIVSVNRARMHGTKGYKTVVKKLISEEQFNIMINTLISKTLAVPAQSSKGGSLWKQMKKTTDSNVKKARIV